MKALFIDCSMGAAGDMLTAALLELTEDKGKAVGELNALGLSHISYKAKPDIKCGITGTLVHVLVDGDEEGEHHHHDHHHHSHSLKDIEEIINATNADGKVKEAANGVYRLLAEAESEVHGTEIDNIHFHEVGTLDAVADILACCYLIDRLGVDCIISSAVNVGKGMVKCAHGVLPVPAPATALLLRNVPIYSGNGVDGELCTPTGAALLKFFADEFEDMPVMEVEKIGYGMGKKNFDTANCVRMLLGEYDKKPDGDIVEMSFNIDDMTAEEIAFGVEELRQSGVNEVFCTPADMKKNRLGTMVTVLCTPEKKAETLALIFRHFSTLGIRETICRRYTMERKITEVQTKFGTVRRKDSTGYGVTKSKYEYDDLSRLARENGCSIAEIKAAIQDGE